MIGDLDPTKPEFREYLDRYHRNKLFLGIRYGNVWPGHDLVTAVQKPEFIENMKAFAQTGAPRGPRSHASANSVRDGAHGAAITEPHPRCRSAKPAVL